MKNNNPHAENTNRTDSGCPFLRFRPPFRAYRTICIANTSQLLAKLNRRSVDSSLRSHAAPTESPSQTQDTIAEADLHDSEEREAQAELEEVAQCPIVGSPIFHNVQTPPSELLQRYLDREPFKPTKKVPGSLRGGDDVLLRPPPAEKDEYCALSPPTPLPVLSGDLERFVSLLLAKDGAEIKNGKFQFAVPESLHDEYHYLSEYRAKYVREAFCFAWAG